MKHFGTLVLSLTFIGLLLAQPPRKEEEDPNARGKTPPPIDIESFPDPKNPNPKHPVPHAPTKPSEPKPNDGPGVTPGKGVLVVGVRQLPTRMTPSRARTDPDHWALDLVFEGLLRPSALDGGTTFTPGLALGPPTSEQGGRTFDIDPMAQWTDTEHSPVMASDVLATIERMRAAGDSFLGDAFSDSPRRVRLTFRGLHPDPSALCSFKILPGGRDTDEFARRPIGSGPFVYSDRVTEGKRDYAVFKFNPQYAQRAGRNNRPVLREVRFLEGSVPLADFRRGIADIILEENTAAITAISSDDTSKSSAPNNLRTTNPSDSLGTDARLVTRPSRRIYYLALNPIKVALGGDSGRSLRRAIAFGINRERILDETWRQPGQPFHHPLTGPFPPDTWPADPTAMSLDDESLAKAELRSVKLPTGKLVFVYPSDEHLPALAAPIIAEQLTAIGIPTEAKGLADVEFRKVVLAEKTFDLAWRHFDFRDEWFDPAMLFQLDNGGVGGTGTFASRMELALARCSVRNEFTALREARHRLHREFRDVMPFVPLWNPDVHIILRRTVEPAPSADLIDPLQPFIDIDRWRVNR